MAAETCLGLGTVGITGAAIGIGKGIVGSILGGNSSGSGSGASYPMSLAGGSKVGCSGTPYISLTPSTDSCAVYIPTGATSSSSVNLGGLSRSPSVSSLLMSNASGTGASPTVSNALLNSGTGAVSASQTGTGGQSTGTISAGTGTTQAGKVSSSLLSGGLSTGGVSYTLGGNSSVTSSATGAGLSAFISNVGNTLLSGFTGGASGSSASNAGAGLLNLVSGNTNNTSAAGVGALLGNYETGTGSLPGVSQSVVSIPQKPSGVQSGTWGDIQATVAGATIAAGGHGTDGRTGIAGFYGYSKITGITPQNLARQMCSARPWASLPATSVIQPEFFDSICIARGYKEVAVLPAANSTSAGAGATQNSGATAPSGTSNASKKVTVTAEPSLPVGPVMVAAAPRVDIYAVPARVRIGARSTIYWSTKGVTECAASSPDGSFSGDTLSGAASTVALYENTEFTITCITPDGSSVSKSVTVETSS